MKSHLFIRHWHWLVLTMTIVAPVYLYADDAPDAGMDSAQKALAQTRLELQKQGFKTDLTNFDFSTSPELQAREAVLDDTAAPRNAAPFLDHPRLLEPTASNQVIIVWQQGILRRQNPTYPDNSYDLTWADFRQAVNERQPQIDAACAAILSGPIQFNLKATNGNYMLLPHLALLKDLTLTLNDRAMLALHDGDRNAAWTNLLAATRLVTDWKVEPAEISHEIQFTDAYFVFGATWQLIQAGGWSDEQLARLLQEWETADFLSSLPEIQAFQRASDLDALEQAPAAPGLKVPAMPGMVPLATPAGQYEDEKRLLLFYRDRELEYRNAVQADSWMQMRQMPAVTIELVFRPKYRYRGNFAMLLYRRQTERQNEQRINQTPSFFGQAAQAETERRIIIAALALARYHEKYGAYPDTLRPLVPEFLKSVPSDFMNGQPLHYQVSEDGHFLLYSVGLDCVDNGGAIPKPPTREEQYARITNPDQSAPESDIVWPLPASSEVATAEREQQSQADAARKAMMEMDEKANEARAEELRQAVIKGLLTMKPPFVTNELVYRGEPLNQALQNVNSGHSVQMSMDDLLSLKQIANTDGDDIATFEVPMNYDAVKKVGELRLLVDAGGLEPTNSIWTDSNPDVRAYEGGGELQDVKRADNGDCILEWNTDYDHPGQHALRAQLLYSGGQMDYEVDLRGPVFPYLSTNAVQFFEGDSMFTDKGATLYAKTAEPHAVYSIEIKSENGKLLKTIKGTTTNGIIDVDWDLRDDHGNKCTNSSFESTFNVTFPDSDRSQAVK